MEKEQEQLLNKLYKIFDILICTTEINERSQNQGC